MNYDYLIQWAQVHARTVNGSGFEYVDVDELIREIQRMKAQEAR